MKKSIEEDLRVKGSLGAECESSRTQFDPRIRFDEILTRLHEEGLQWNLGSLV